MSRNKKVTKEVQKIGVLVRLYSTNAMRTKVLFTVCPGQRSIQQLDTYAMQQGV